MRGNLSVVLDKDMKVRLDLFANISLSEIDQYTISKSSSKDIRSDFSFIIDSFLNRHRDFIQTFKEGANREGSLVIVYEDSNARLHKMRVLYRENVKKTDPMLMIRPVFDTLRNQGNPYFTIDMMKHFSFFLGSNYDLREITKIQKSNSRDEAVLKKQNQRLVNIVRNHVRYALDSDYEKGYFYLRLIDSYLENRGYETTKRVLSTKYGKVEFSPNTFKGNISLVKESPYQNLVLESDGQYALFEIPTDPPKEERQPLTYDRFIEEQDWPIEEEFERSKKR